MTSFTGVSIVVDGNLSTTSHVDTGADTGYHLLMVQGYAGTNQEVPTGAVISSGRFIVGGRGWHIDYYPNGENHECADFISIYLCLDDDDDDDVQLPIEVHLVFSFMDEVEKQKPVYIRAMKPSSFLHQGELYRRWGYDTFMTRDAIERSTHLKNDCFTIRCDVMVCKDPNTHDDDATMSDVGQHLNNLLQNKVATDVTFKVRGETFTAHRCVLAARSKVFMAQLFGPMKEGNMSSVIQIDDMEPKVFRALLSFIYTGSFLDMEDVDMEEDKEEENIEYVTRMQNMLVAADIYDLQRLKRLCEEELSEYIGVSSVASTLAVAEQHYCHGLKEACFKFIQVQSPPCLEKVTATDDWEHIRTTYPSIMDEINVMLASKT